LDPCPQAGRATVGRSRWARCPYECHLHLLAPAEVLRAAGAGHVQALCGQRIPAEGFTITSGLSWALCMTCVIGIPAKMVDPGPRGTAPSSPAGRR
jgi:hypothetical protein